MKSKKEIKAMIATLTAQKEVHEFASQTTAHPDLTLQARINALYWVLDGKMV